ncbi:MAG: TonB-dependent receptor, partial [Rhodanobacter sp.]
MAFALALVSAHAAAADATQDKPKATTQDKSSATNLGTVEVKGTSRQAILPTAATIDGPFGPGRSMLDTPRSVTPISADLMRATGVNNLRDIMKLAPDTYSPTDFGAPSLPDIRGQLGEVFEDGMRQQGGNNGFGLPLSFNAVDSINVVKGPPPVVLGTTQRVGGFVDLQLKRPDLDTSGGFVELGSGSWNRNWGQLDYSTPITPGKSALRLSVEDHNEGSYYDYAHHHSQDVFLAYRLKPDAVSELNASVEYYHVNFTDIAGINRPTQNLIDHGLYVTGQGVQPDGSTVPGAFAVISPTGEVRIPRHRVLTDPADRDSVRTWIAHLRYERSLSDETRYISRTYYQHLERNEVANDSFVEIIKGADTAEHRSELVLDRDADLFGHTTHQQTDLGIDVRWNHVLGYSQFDTEADLPVDLTGPISNRRIPLTSAQQAQLVLLRPGLYVSPGAQYPRNGQAAGYLLSDTTDSNSYQSGVFVQHEIRFTPQWSVMAGVRGDEYYVTAKDPIPPPGQLAAHDGAHHFLKAANGSVTWKPVDAIALYAAGSYSQSTSNSIGGGTPLGAGNRIDPASFATDSTLYEIGLKLAPPQGRWYADVSLFDQTRSLRNRDGSNS